MICSIDGKHWSCIKPSIAIKKLYKVICSFPKKSSNINAEALNKQLFNAFNTSFSNRSHLNEFKAINEIPQWIRCRWVSNGLLFEGDRKINQIRRSIQQNWSSITSWFLWSSVNVMVFHFSSEQQKNRFAIQPIDFLFHSFHSHLEFIFSQFSLSLTHTHNFHFSRSTI